VNNCEFCPFGHATIENSTTNFLIDSLLGVSVCYHYSRILCTMDEGPANVSKISFPSILPNLNLPSCRHFTIRHFGPLNYYALYSSLASEMAGIKYVWILTMILTAQENWGTH
jgi:hypothetical protein